jgi:hypothetical protein
VAPQDAFLKQWAPARAAWANGQKVERLIGYDTSPSDSRRHAHAAGLDDPLFQCRYPLREWNWTRDRCIARIEAAGLPVPPKSSCFFCGAIRPDEVRALPAWCLRLIVLIEARAEPRLRTVEIVAPIDQDPARQDHRFHPRRAAAPRGRDRRDPSRCADRSHPFQDAASIVPIAERPTMEEWIASFNAGLMEGMTSTISRIAELNDRVRLGLDRNARIVMTATCLATLAGGDRIVSEAVAQAAVRPSGATNSSLMTARNATTGSSSSRVTSSAFASIITIPRSNGARRSCRRRGDRPCPDDHAPLRRLSRSVASPISNQNGGNLAPHHTRDVRGRTSHCDCR